MKNYITYPKVGTKFSLKNLLSQQNLQKDPKKKLTKVGLFLKVKRDIERGILVKVGERKHAGRGRPQALFTRVVSPESVTSPTVEIPSVSITAPSVEIAAAIQQEASA